MVLQRSPASAMVYGHAKQGATVTTTFGGNNYTTVVDSVDLPNATMAGLGTWRQALPPTPASKTPYTITFASSAGDHGLLEDVLFGEVYFCSGQSNMEDPMLTQINSTEECERANGAISSTFTSRLLHVCSISLLCSPFDCQASRRSGSSRWATTTRAGRSTTVVTVSIEIDDRFY